MYSTSQISNQKPLPGYTGYRPQYADEVGGLASSPDLIEKESAPSRIPGYCGYIPGVKAENVFGESYGKTST